MQRAALILAVAIAAAGCAGNGEGLDENGRPIDTGPPPLGPNFNSIQANVFNVYCIGCHTGAGAPLGLRLDAASSYALLVNTASQEVPGLMRVQPGNPGSSYLIQKVEGSAAVGGRMPLNQPPLPQATISVIRQWITEGAQRSTNSAPSTAPAALTAVSPQADDILAAPPREIVVTTDTELNTTLLTSASVVLTRSGSDGSFAEGNEVGIAPLSIEVRSLEPTVLAITVPTQQWAVDSYRLTIAGAGPAPVADRRGQEIDGDGDGRAGGDFNLYFDVGGGSR
jgi:hypothetical protein